MSIRKTGLTIFLLPILCLSSPAIEHWNQFRGPAEDGKTNNTGLPTEAETRTKHRQGRLPPSSGVTVYQSMPKAPAIAPSYIRWEGSLRQVALEGGNPQFCHAPTRRHSSA